MKKEIKVTLKESFGVTRIYPACLTAKNFCKLLAQTTLTPCNMRHIEELGFEIVEVKEDKLKDLLK